MTFHPTFGIQPGDIVRHVESCQERVVSETYPEHGLIEFVDDLTGCVSSQGWYQTGKRVDDK